MTLENQKNPLNARIAVLVFAIISIVLVINRAILLGYYETSVPATGIFAEVLSALPKLALIVYAAVLYRIERARILPFVLFILLVALNAFTVMGSGYDVINWLSNGDTLKDQTVREHLGKVILAALSVAAFVLLMIGTWKSFSKPLFSIVPLCILMVAVGISVGFYGFSAIRPVIEQMKGIVPENNDHTNVLNLFTGLSNLLFYIAIGLFVLKNRDFTVRSIPTKEEAKSE